MSDPASYNNILIPGYKFSGYMRSTMRYDIAVIGTGPAGVSAAITAKVRNKNIILIGPESMSRKIRKAQTIRNYPGLPDISGDALADAYNKQLASLGIEITDTKVNMVYSMGNYFSLQTSGGILEASAVILATGVIPGASLPGENDYLGRGVSYCATCDALFYKGKTVAVIGYSQKAEEEAEFLAETSEKVYYFPVTGAEYKNCGIGGYDVQGAAASEKYHNIEVIYDIPQKITGELKADTLVCSGRSYQADGIFVLRDNIAADRLVPGLNMVNGHVETDMSMCTNIKGCFACGDITGTPYQYIKAAGQGNVAALSAVDYLKTLL